MSAASAPASLSFDQALGAQAALAVPSTFEPWEIIIQGTAAFNIRSPGLNPADPLTNPGTAFAMAANTPYRLPVSRTALPIVDGTGTLSVFVLGLNNGAAVPTH